MSDQARKYILVAAALLIALMAFSALVESNWSEPTVVVTGIPASATLDQPLEFQVKVRYHNRFDITSVGTRVIKPLVAKSLLERREAHKLVLGFFEYSRFPIPRSRTYTIHTSLRDMLTQPPGIVEKKKLKVPEKVRFDLRVNGWMVRHSRARLTMFTGLAPDQLNVIQRDYEIEVTDG